MEFVARQIAKARAKHEEDQQNRDARYYVRNNATYAIAGRNGMDEIKLTNFVARIKEEQVLDDGMTEKRRYRMGGVLEDGTALSEVTIESTQLRDPKWVDEHWGGRTVVLTPFGATLQAAIKTISAGEFSERQVFAHLGWRHVDGDWVYLHADGAIGANGPVDGISVELSGTAQHCVLLENGDGNSAKVAIRTSLRMLDVGTIGTVVAGATYKAPLGEVSPHTLTIHLSGVTGKGKSFLCGIAQAHWGVYFDGQKFPAGWTDTQASLEKNGFAYKDTLFGIDDFKPRGQGKKYIEELCAKGEYVIRAHANHMGRQRLRSDLTSHGEYYPRGVILSSGEDIPTGQSLRARMMIVEVQPDSINKTIAKELHDAAAKGVLSQAMAVYVRWIAPRMDELRAWADIRRVELVRSVTVDHARTATNFAELMMALETFLRCALEVGAITEEEHTERLAAADTNLRSLLGLQDEEQRSEDEVEVFLTGLGEALAAGLCHLVNYNEGKTDTISGVECTEAVEPPDPEACGWISEPSYMTDQLVWRRRGYLVGWRRDETLYILLGPARKAVETLLQSPISLTSKTLLKRLRDAEAIVDADQGKNQKTIRRAITPDDGHIDNRPTKTVALSAERVLVNRYGTKDVDQQDGPPF